MQVKLNKTKETRYNPEKQEKTKDTSFPPGAGETTKDKLCGSLTLLQS
jgi:hypothetical protein